MVPVQSDPLAVVVIVVLFGIVTEILLCPVIVWFPTVVDPLITSPSPAIVPLAYLAFELFIASLPSYPYPVPNHRPLSQNP